MIIGVFPPRGRPLAAHGNAVGLIRYKTLSNAGAPQDEATLLDGPGMLGCLFSVFFFGDGFPMALPWAKREVPLAGRQICRKAARFF